MNINTPPDKIAEYLDKNFYQDIQQFYLVVC